MGALPRLKHSLRAGLFVWLAATASTALADETHYRWLDDRGNPVHSDRPPPAGIEYEVISTQSGFKRMVPGAVGAVPLEVEPRVGNEFTPVPKQSEATRKNPEICEIARKNLETLNTFARVQVRGDQGDIEYLSDEEKEAQRNEATSLIQQHCD